MTLGFLATDGSAGRKRTDLKKKALKIHSWRKVKRVSWTWCQQCNGEGSPVYEISKGDNIPQWLYLCARCCRRRGVIIPNPAAEAQTRHSTP